MMSHPFIRLAFFGLIVMLLLYGLTWVAFGLILIAGLFYNAYEYIFAAFCLDCYFAPNPYALWYTLVVSALVVGAMVLRPYMRLTEHPD